MEPIGQLFPAGGRVEPAQMIGREGDRTELVTRMREGLHPLVTGPRRIGKTTVCNAACVELADQHEFLIVEVEVPQQATALGVSQLVIDRCTRVDLDHAARRAGKVVRPAVEALLKSAGIPLDLSTLGGDLPPATRRAAMALPLKISEQHGRRVVLFFDELQRAVDYADGEGLVADIVDLYAGQSNVVVLIDGSHERVLDRLLGAPFGVAKLAERVELPPTIPLDQWRGPLRERFARAELELNDDRLERLLEFGAGRPYETMTAARHVAFTARKLATNDVDDFVLEQGLHAASEALDDDER